MQKSRLSSLLTSTAAGLFGLAAMPAMAQTGAPVDKAANVDEVVVVGSAIRGLSFEEVGSPVTVLNAVELGRLGMGAKLNEALQFIPQNVGVYRNGGSNQNNVVDGNYGGGSVDIRGLGPGSTLVLVNGARQARFPLADDGRVDINALVPMIAINSVEILRNGASAVYGTDAVSGVVNFRTASNFEGLKVQADARGTTGGFEHWSYTTSLLAGRKFANGWNLVGAAEWYDSNNFTYGDLGLIKGPSDAYLTNSWPGNFRVPRRTAAGALTTSTTQLPDPQCAQVAQQGVTQNPEHGSDTYFDAARNVCLGALKNGTVIPSEQRLNLYLSLAGDLTPSTTFRLNGAYSDRSTGTTFTPTLSSLRPITVPGENPGNTFRAVNASGAPIFARDANGDGRPDRNAAGAVILAPEPTNPASGVAFNEDVIGLFRPLSTTNARYFMSDDTTRTGRINGEVVKRLGGDWSATAGFVAARQALTVQTPDTNYQALLDALAGRGGPNRNQYFNPFASSLSASAGSPLANDPAVIAGFLALSEDKYVSTVATIDLSASGSLFELPAGSVKVALGGQWRREGLKFDFDQRRTSGELAFNATFDQDFKVSSQAYGLFGEAYVPLFDGAPGKLDASMAVRYEKSEDSESSLDPKVTLSWSSDLYRLQGSYSTSFQAPGLFQKAGVRGNFANINDPVRGSSYQALSRIVGNPDLAPQQSTSWSVGASVFPIQGFKLDLDYFSYEFTDLIVSSSAQAVLNANPNGADVTRDAQGFVSLINRPFFNAANITMSGIDASASYKAPTRFGDFGVQVNGTLVTRYDFRSSATSPVIDGVGNTNVDTVGMQMPEVRANARFTWDTGGHGVALTIRHQSKMKNVQAGFTEVAKEQTRFDAQYSYAFEDLGTQVTVGAINLFDQRPNRIMGAAGQFYAGRQDPIPRYVYVTIAKTF